jgi:MurNAc alpha-1-phosphate uridylyltransferase
VRVAELPPVCILAGGLGTRLGSFVHDRPKPLILVAEEPFVFHQLRALAEHGAGEIVMCVGHFGEMIEDEVGTERFGLTIRYSYDAPGLSGTLGAIRHAEPFLAERFLVLYGDTYLAVDYQAMVKDWVHSATLGAMSVLHNRGKWGPSNTVVERGEVVRHNKRARTARMEWIDYGLGALKSSALDLVDNTVTDLSDLYDELANRAQLRAFEVRERFYEIGTPDQLAETDAYLRSRGDALGSE